MFIFKSGNHLLVLSEIIHGDKEEYIGLKKRAEKIFDAELGDVK